MYFKNQILFLYNTIDLLTLQITLRISYWGIIDK